MIAIFTQTSHNRYKTFRSDINDLALQSSPAAGIRTWMERTEESRDCMSHLERVRDCF
ncbi:hypothetical protein COO91_06095 [Nostoc flagelliforme CCNUN1]|uniref:Uncharacterized protein n=1 Tax=Nostoc flagelliforme CCNUN1 TaxID=2038116 RepID=A0A2K8SZC4_9NOSO|nr:hypothetical protein COO91_06095 [Nostoc flagelliforme CCNUN1]